MVRRRTRNTQRNSQRSSPRATRNRSENREIEGFETQSRNPTRRRSTNARSATSQRNRFRAEARNISTETNTKAAVRAAIRRNKEAQWSAYRSLQQKAERALAKLRSDIQRKASRNVILKDRNELMLLLGECNYMTRECMRVASQGRRNNVRRKTGKRA